MQRVLVTGATGFIGKHTLPLLVGKGFEVQAISSKPVQSDNNYIWHQADLLKINELEDLLAQVSPSHLLHFAWYSEPKSINELIDFMVVRLFDSLGETLRPINRWSGPTK